MYKVIDVAKMFSVSKVTIYKKITSNKEELKGHIFKKKNVTYLDDDAVEIIKNSIQTNSGKASGRFIDEELKKLYSEFSEISLEIEYMKKEKKILLEEQSSNFEATIRYLKSQIKVKKNHIEMENEILNDFKNTLKINKDRIRVLDQILIEFKNFN